jgi:hypothetical protein
MKRLVELAAATVAVTGSLGLAGLAIGAGAAQAVVGPAPEYHWCPGDGFDPGWGQNWDPGVCHDDYHRDSDGFDHSRDWGGPPPGYEFGGPPPAYDVYGPPPWQPPPPPEWGPPPLCIPFVGCPPG